MTSSSIAYWTFEEDIPYLAVIAVFAVFFVLSLIFERKKSGWKKFWHAFAVAGLVAWVILILMLTIIYRRENPYRVYNFNLLRTYQRIINGSDRTFKDVGYNMLMLLPMGLFIPIIWDKVKFWHVLLICGGFSLCIETTQFITCRGSFELGDILHNTMGALIGYWMCMAVKRIVGRTQGSQDDLPTF